MARKSARKRATRTTRTTRPKRSAPRKPDAIRLLKEDHAKVSALFARFEKTRADAQKEKIAETICSELKIHTTIEEELFYPAAREALRQANHDLLDEAQIEHDSAKVLIERIEAGSPADDDYDALVKVLSEYIKHHVKEEQTELFPKVQKTDLDLAALGDRMEKRKESLQGGPATRAVGRVASLVASAQGPRMQSPTA
jgi:iron-sulfur cluster repair protein YtfE (RIC family)